MRRRRNWPGTRVRWPASGRLLTVRTVASIVMTVLFLSGCASSRKAARAEVTERTMAGETQSASQWRADSASEVVEIRTEALKVPQSEVRMTIAADSLRKLPEGAVYADKSGQAHVSVSRKAATATEPEYIYVYASCDSLALQCERYERTIRDMKRSAGASANTQKAQSAETHSAVEKEKRQGGHGTPLKWYLTGILTGLLLPKTKKIISTIKKGIVK